MLYKKGFSVIIIYRDLFLKKERIDRNDALSQMWK